MRARGRGHCAGASLCWPGRPQQKVPETGAFVSIEQLLARLRGSPPRRLLDRLEAASCPCACQHECHARLISLSIENSLIPLTCTLERQKSWLVEADVWTPDPEPHCIRSLAARWRRACCCWTARTACGAGSGCSWWRAWPRPRLGWCCCWGCRARPPPPGACPRPSARRWPRAGPPNASSPSGGTRPPAPPDVRRWADRVWFSGADRALGRPAPAPAPHARCPVP